MIEKEEIPSYKKFTHESTKKRQKRTAKIKKEEKEAEELKSELGLGSGINLIYFSHLWLLLLHLAIT